MRSPERPNYYEILQVSPRAHALVISKAYRLLAALYHPDNQETGDEEMFRLVVEAARVLTDPVSRSAYDAGRLDEATVRGGVAPDLAGDGDSRRGLLDEPCRRVAVLEALYNLRRSRPDRPSVPIRVIPELLGTSMEEAQFTIWYLRGKRFIENTDDGWAITVAGVDYLEATRGTGRAEDTAPLLSLKAPEQAMEAV
jgi:curved DNA-binding protein CbpA